MGRAQEEGHEEGTEGGPEGHEVGGCSPGAEVLGEGGLFWVLRH